MLDTWVKVFNSLERLMLMSSGFENFAVPGNVVWFLQPLTKCFFVFFFNVATKCNLF